VSTHEQPSDVSRLLKRRARRVPATWLLGRDASIAPVPRLLARTLSAYERATIRAVAIALLQEVPVVDVPFLWLARRAVFALAGRARGDDDPMLDIDVPGSGWGGDLLVVLTWAVLIGGVACLVG
jgi:hypothetical protein